MRKLKLEVEELTVESFATGAGGGRAGTVKGRADLAADHDGHAEDGHAFGREGGIAGITGTCMCTLNCAVPTRYLTCGSTCAC